MSLQTQAEAFLAQERIAVVGVSRKGGTGKEIFQALRKRGYEVVPVNPNASEVHGKTCYPKVSAIDGKVGAVVVATRAEMAEGVMRDCVEAGAAHVWLHYNALFGAKSSSVSQEAVDYGREHGVEVIAGGCPLMFGNGADLGHRCMRWWLSVTKKLPRVSGRGEPGE